MTFLWPWSLLGLLVVAVAAVLALFRPARQMAIVGSLELWQQAAATMDRSQRRRTRRISAAWVCLLAGALAAAFAAARPVWQTQAPARQVAVIVVPTAEVPAAEIKSSVGRLLDRLSPADRVQLVLPAQLGGEWGAGRGERRVGSGENTPPHQTSHTNWISPARARDAIAKLTPLPVWAPEIGRQMPQPSQQAQHVFIFSPPTPNSPLSSSLSPLSSPLSTLSSAGPNTTVIVLPVSVPPVTFWALGAADVPGGKMQVFLALANHTGQPRQIDILRTSFAADGAAAGPELWQSVTVQAGGEWRGVWDQPPAAAVAVQLREGGAVLAGPGTSGYLARRQSPKVKLALAGVDDPMIRRFARVYPGVELVADAADTDVVTANRADTTTLNGKPALVLAPLAAPTGYAEGPVVENVALSQANVAADAVLKDVDLSSIAVQRLTTWSAGEDSPLRRLATYQGNAIVLADPAVAGGPRRVYVSFDISQTNATFSATPSFVIFLANVVNFLGNKAPAATAYEYASPLTAAASDDWKPLTGGAVQKFPGGPLAQPGIYRDSAGELHAVSLVGQPAQRPAASTAPAPVDISALPLPPPQIAASRLWPALVLAAMVFWLAGWALRSR